MKILILCHEYDSQKGYYINHLISAWEDAGYEVFIRYGLAQPLPRADIAILHVDLTITPPEYVYALKDYPVVLNRNITDISKSNYQSVYSAEG